MHSRFSDAEKNFLLLSFMLLEGFSKSFSCPVNWFAAARFTDELEQWFCQQKCIVASLESLETHTLKLENIKTLKAFGQAGIFCCQAKHVGYC